MVVYDTFDFVEIDEETAINGEKSAGYSTHVNAEKEI